MMWPPSVARRPLRSWRSSGLGNLRFWYPRFGKRGGKVRPPVRFTSPVSRLESRVHIPPSHRGPWQGVTTKAYQQSDTPRRNNEVRGHEDRRDVCRPSKTRHPRPARLQWTGTECTSVECAADEETFVHIDPPKLLVSRESAKLQCFLRRFAAGAVRCFSAKSRLRRRSGGRRPDSGVSSRARSGPQTLLDERHRRLDTRRAAAAPRNALEPKGTGAQPAAHRLLRR